MIIELVGLPGSGKTTFAKRLAERDGWTLVSVRGRGEILFFNLLFFLRHPLVFVRTLLPLIRYCGRRELWYMKFVNLFLVHNAKYMKAARYPRAVIDQGHHQNVISLFDERVPDEIIGQYARILPKPDLLLFFVTPPDVRTKRLAGRGYGTRDAMDDDYRNAWEAAREEHFERLYLIRATLPCAVDLLSPENEERQLERIASARIWHYVLHGRMPTEKAHGQQIAKTLEALSRKGVYVTLWLPRGDADTAARIAAGYALEGTFAVRSFGVPDLLRLPAFFGQVKFWLDAAVFFVRLFVTRISREGVFYTRNPELAWLFALRGAEAWYEAHRFPSSKIGLLCFFLRHVTGVIANSQGTADALLRAGISRVSVVRNGVDLGRFAEALPQDAARALLGLPEGVTMVAYIGAFYAWKGVPFLLETWRRNFATRNDLTLLLVGGTEEDLARYGGRGAYRALSNVRLVPHVPAEETVRYLFAADVLVLPNSRITEESVRYTSPIKLFEYMATGKPIVAADLPSIREVLTDETGFFFRADESDALAEALSSALASPDEMRMRGARAREASQRYGWDARAQLLMRIVQGNVNRSENVHRQFLKSTMSVCVTAAFYFSLIYVLTEYIGIWHLYSVPIAYASAIVVNFLLLKLVFVGGMQRTVHEFFRFLLLAFANIFVNTVAAYILVERLHVWYMLAQLLIVGGLAVANFFVYRSYVFPRGKQ